MKNSDEFLEEGLNLYEAFGGNKELLIELLDKAKEAEFYKNESEQKQDELEQSKAEIIKLKEQLAKFEAQKDKK